MRKMWFLKQRVLGNKHLKLLSKEVRIETSSKKAYISSGGGDKININFGFN